MDEMRTEIRISVRSLVEFILREGDLDNRITGKADPLAMQAGSRLHRKIQKRMGAGYAAEVPLKIKVPMGEFDCVVEGRADGIFSEDGMSWIDEIKGVYRDLGLIEKPLGVHLAQALCYAFIYASQQELPEIGVQLTYGNLETEELKAFRETRTREELEEWFSGLLEEYRKWAGFQFEWKRTRKESIRPLEFPFPYREGQYDLAAGVYRTIARKKRLFIQAPTGVGKTISTVFPAVKAVGEGLGDRIFYLTAKTVTRTVAEETFRILREKGLRMKTVTLTAKEKLCICEEVQCNPEACPYAKGHFDRVNAAVFELLTEGPDELSREVLLKQAHKHQVCPFELSLDTASWTDAVICDYNYVFDPGVRLKRFFAEGVKGEYLFLIDEAHNLVERGREMFSAFLCKEDFLELKRKVKGRYKKAERCLERCNKYLLGLKKECDTYQLHEDVGAFVLQLLSLSTELDRIREEGADPELQKEVLDFWFQVRDFLNTADRLDENYVIYSEIGEDGHFRLKLYCVETAKSLRECLDKGNAAIFFSATLLPMPYYKHLLGDENDYAVYACSPFSAEKRLLLLGQDVSSRYTRRNRTEYERIADYLAAMTEGRKGNYLAFFPSYRMMQEVFEVFQDKYGGLTECAIQRSGMKEEE
ncbi:MAG: ATP-dependent DNA helicase, partial [Candidatus Merdisoma sp.]